MTNKEILERAGRIMQSLDRIHIAAALEHAAEHCEPESGSVDVRIAVATNVYGDWHAFGGSGFCDNDSIFEARTNVSEDEVDTVIITARVRRRQIQTVAGTVEAIDPEATI